MAEQAVEPLKYAITERGKPLNKTEKEVRAILTTLALNGGSPSLTMRQLAEEDIKMDRNALRRWRNTCFPRLYAQIRQELGKDIGEKLAGNAYERALQADEATELYLKAAIKRLDEVPPEHLGKNAQSLAAVFEKTIEKAQTLRHEPNQIEAAIDIADSIKELERLGIVQSDEPKRVENLEQNQKP